ncbi:MAG: OmpA family protein [Saccharospirillum sp.]|nr:OmpA family protein [Saccharospirillum sp.]
MSQEFDEDDCPECEPGLPPWIATFADLMALLLVFFVLLLSFSEMDAQRFKRLAGSMRDAFGIQAEIFANEIPKGTSIIAQEFSPGRPEPTPLNVIRQDTIDAMKDSLDVMCQDMITQQEEAQGESGQLTRQITVPDQALQEQVQAEAERIAEALADVIADGLVEVETIDQTIIIRVKEQSFGAGTDFVADDYLPILDRVREVLLTVPGSISVEGHTDNLPISTPRFRNNWLLSSARALAVAEYLWASPEMAEDRFTIVGHGSTRPLASNDTPEGRASNRRVEINVLQDNPDFEGDRVPRDQQGDALDVGPPSLFGLQPEEIF